jgi:hypothetical protein
MLVTTKNYLVNLIVINIRQLYNPYHEDKIKLGDDNNSVLHLIMCQLNRLKANYQVCMRKYKKQNKYQHTRQ